MSLRRVVRIVEYEALVTELFRKLRAVGMCQYDRSRLPADVIDHALATHGTVVLDGAQVVNPFVTPTSVARTRTPQPDDVPSKISELRMLAAAQAAGVSW
jgi:hypothetical protein